MLPTYQRTYDTLQGKTPDKIPFYYPTIACSVGSQILGRPVNTGMDSMYFAEDCAYLKGVAAHREFVEKMQDDTIELYRILKADLVRETLRERLYPTKRVDEYTLMQENDDGSYIVKRFFPNTQSYGVIEDTTSKPSDSDELAAWMQTQMQKPSTMPTTQELDAQYADHLRFKAKAERYFPCTLSACSVYTDNTNPVWLETMVLEPDTMSEYLLYRSQYVYEHMKYLKDKGYYYINAGCDLAAQNAPFYSPATFEAVILPALSKVCNAANQLDIKYGYRTDGNTWPLFDLLFKQSGVHVYGECDRDAGMSVAKVRGAAPDLVVLGNVCSATLNLASEEEVREQVRATLHESGGSHYIAGPSNAIMPGTPVENIYAMVEEIEKYRPRDITI